MFMDKIQKLGIESLYHQMWILTILMQLIISINMMAEIMFLTKYSQSS